MFFGKNKTSLKLSKPHPGLIENCEYHVVESVKNPTKVNVGIGITKLFLKNNDGDEFIIEGNSTKIKELLVPIHLFENVTGPSFKIKLPVGSLQKNTLLKETTSVHPDEKIHLGYGVSERYFVQEKTNKIIKFIGNPSQIKNILQENKQEAIKQIQQQSKPNTSNEQVVKIVLEEYKNNKTPNTIIERVIVEQGEQGPVGPKGEAGKIGPIGPRGPQGEPGIKGDKGDKGDKGEKGDLGKDGKDGKNGKDGKRGLKGDRGDRGERGIQGVPGLNGEPGPMGPVGPQGPPGIQGLQGKQGIQGPRGEKGKDGISPVIEAQYPLVLEDGVISFESNHVSSILEKFKNESVQQVIQKMTIPTTPAGGGGLDIALNGEKILRNAHTLNFLGQNITVTRKRKNVDVTITGGGGDGNAGFVQSATIPPATFGWQWYDTENARLYNSVYDGNNQLQWIQLVAAANTNTQTSIHNTVFITGSTYSVLTTDYYIGVSFNGSVSVTLPSNPETGRELVIKDESGNASSNHITIQGANVNDKIDNLGTGGITSGNGSLRIIYRSGWRII